MTVKTACWDDAWVEESDEPPPFIWGESERGNVRFRELYQQRWIASILNRIDWLQTALPRLAKDPIKTKYLTFLRLLGEARQDLVMLEGKIL